MIIKLFGWDKYKKAQDAGDEITDVGLVYVSEDVYPCGYEGADATAPWNV